MSGGDFVNLGECSRLLRRCIEDRSKMVRDLRAIMDTHGAESAAIMLGCTGSSELFGIVEKRFAIQAPLLEMMYGPRGAKLKDGLTSKAERAAARPVAPHAAAVVSNPTFRASISSAPAAPAAAKALPTGIVAGAISDAERAVALETMQRALRELGSMKKASQAIGIGWSTIGFLLSGQKPITARTAALVRAWAAANPAAKDAAPLAGGDAGADAVTGEATEAPPPEFSNEQNSTAALSAEPHTPEAPTDLPRAAVERAAESPPVTPPSNLSAGLAAANDDPFADAMAPLLVARDRAVAARTALADEMSAIEAEIEARQRALRVLRDKDSALLARWSKLQDAVEGLIEAAK